MLDRTQLMGLTAREMTVLVGGTIAQLASVTRKAFADDAMLLALERRPKRLPKNKAPSSGTYE